MTTALRPGSYSEQELEAEHTRPKHMQAEPDNIHAKYNRKKKVERLVACIDKELGHIASGYAAEAIADQLEVWPLEAWIQLAWKARVLTTSIVSIGEVIGVYRTRAALKDEKF